MSINKMDVDLVEDVTDEEHKLKIMSLFILVGMILLLFYFPFLISASISN